MRQWYGLDDRKTSPTCLSWSFTCLNTSEKGRNILATIACSYQMFTYHGWMVPKTNPLSLLILLRVRLWGKDRSDPEETRLNVRKLLFVLATSSMCSIGFLAWAFAQFLANGAPKGWTTGEKWSILRYTPRGWRKAQPTTHPSQSCLLWSRIRPETPKFEATSFVGHHFELHALVISRGRLLPRALHLRYKYMLYNSHFSPRDHAGMCGISR